MLNVCLLVNCIKDDVVFNETRQKDQEFKDLQNKRQREAIRFGNERNSSHNKNDYLVMAYAIEY